MSEPRDVVLDVLINTRLNPEELSLIDALISCLTDTITKVLAAVHFDVLIDIQTVPVRTQHSSTPSLAPANEQQQVNQLSLLPSNF